MIESLIALCSLRDVSGRYHAIELACYASCINHLALCITSVHADAVNGNLSRCSIEVLILQIAYIATIHGVCPLTAELLHIEMVSTLANLLVRVEAYSDLSMLYLLMVAEVAHRLHYLGNAGLVVSTEQCSAIGNYEVLTLVFQKFREFLRTGDDAR